MGHYIVQGGSKLHYSTTTLGRLTDGHYIVREGLNYSTMNERTLRPLITPLKAHTVKYTVRLQLRIQHTNSNKQKNTNTRLVTETL